MAPILNNRPPRTIAITACSAAFYEHYVDLLDSLDVVGLNRRSDYGVIDLGLTVAQIEQLRARGVHRVPGTWPVQPPPGQDRPEFVAFAGKPFARDYFPGYEMYLWIDADMWVQNDHFWRDLVAGATQTGCAVSQECHPGYRAMPVKEQFWMHRHLASAFGLGAAIRLRREPMVNNGLFAMHADAPHWALWQQRFRRLVSRTQRMIAIDQLAMFAMIHLDTPQCRLSGALNNWVCSLGIPSWDAKRLQFVSPDGEPISVLHVTTPARARRFAVPVLGSVESQTCYLHRPGGRIMASLAPEPAMHGQDTPSVRGQAASLPAGAVATTTEPETLGSPRG